MVFQACLLKKKSNNSLATQFRSCRTGLQRMTCVFFFVDHVCATAAWSFLSTRTTVITFFDFAFMWQISCMMLDKVTAKCMLLMLIMVSPERNGIFLDRWYLFFGFQFLKRSVEGCWMGLQLNGEFDTSQWGTCCWTFAYDYYMLNFSKLICSRSGLISSYSVSGSRSSKILQMRQMLSDASNSCSWMQNRAGLSLHKRMRFRTAGKNWTRARRAVLR